MGWYADRVVPRITDASLGRPEMNEIRRRVCAGLAGQVLEVGFGTGRNVPHYPTAVDTVWAVDPSVGARRLAEERVAASAVPVEYVVLDGQRLPVDDGAVDHVLSTWTLCTIPDVHGALREVRRVLRPGGTIHFVEHGRAPDPKVARWQDRLNPLQKLALAGCHLNRPIRRLLEEADLAIGTLATYYFVPGPKVACYFYEGDASRR